jgi:hypothetical protein
MNLPVKHYTETDVTRAHQKGKMIGWIQGGAVVVGGTIVLKLLGSIFPVLALGAVGFAGYKWVTRSSKTDEDQLKEDIKSALVVALALGALLSPLAVEAQTIPSPKEYFGHEMGAEHQVAPWDRLVEDHDQSA